MMTYGLSNTIVITGHYGSGKTNLALNLALALRENGKDVKLADLDIVNPYFRSGDYAAMLNNRGIEVIASEYSGTTLDIPALTARLDAAIGSGSILIIDAGGDDAGAHVLGRYSSRIIAAGYSMLYVVNRYRFLTPDSDDSIRLLRDIEAAGRLKATHIVSCPNLGAETTAGHIINAADFTNEISQKTGLPVAFTAVSRTLIDDIGIDGTVLPVDIIVKAPWNN